MRKTVQNKSRGFAHLLLLIPVLLAIVVGGFWYLNNNKKQAALNTKAQAVEVVEPSPQNLEPVPSSAVTQTSNGMATYHNDKYGYSFEYLKDYLVYVSPPDFIFVKKSNTETNVLAEVGIKHNDSLVFPNPDKYVSKIVNLKNEPFDSYVAKVLYADCYSIQVGEETYCDKVVSQEPYTNPNGLTGYKVVLHLNHVEKDRDGKRTPISDSDWGPVYIFDISDRGIDGVRALVFKPQLAINQDIDTTDTELKKLVDTLRF